MIDSLKNLFAKPSAAVVAQRDLEEAKRLLLRQQSSSEYHARMVQYYTDMVRRLTAYIGEGK